MMDKAISLGEYTFMVDQHGNLVDARRHGVPWESGYNVNRFNNAFMSALCRIVELEETKVPETTFTRAEVLRLISAFETSLQAFKETIEARK